MSKNLYIKILKCGGFSFIELMVVVSIITILTLMFIPNYRSGASQMALQRSANKLYQDMRRVQEMAISSRVCQECSPVAVPANGYGIALAATEPYPYLDNTEYIIYAHNDPDTDNYYYNTTTDTIIETVKLEKGVIVYNINNGNNPHLGINVRPPEPRLGLMCNVCGPAFPHQAEITLALENDLSKTKAIYINVAGLIYEEY
jgi:prepilin-type N-terminal cleavage/methylation domain-containing protein